ncbi:Ig-like domain-containing protein [Colwelliaceae bacterium 6441]
MNKFFAALSILLLSALVGCNGSSGKNDNPNNESSIATSLSLVLINSDGATQQSFDKNEIITVQATVKDQFNTVMSGSRVNFSADLGRLSLNSKLTDSSGVATININNDELTLGAGTLTSSIDSLSAEIDYEYLNSTPNESPLNVTVLMQLNGQASNQFKSNEQVQVQVTLVDNEGNGIKNEIINFSADIGVLSTNTALTNENGHASVSLAGNDVIGAGVVAVTLASDNSVSTQINYQVLPADSLSLDDVRLGYFDDNNEFISGKIKLSIADNTISAGGTLGLSIELVDIEGNYINTPTSVSFTSNCVLNGNANIDETVFSIKGKAGATFEDIDCAGTSGAEDVIVASVTSNGVTNTASATINISSEQLGSIEFVSAKPTTIVIQGSGGQETSTLTFLVKSALGNVLAQQNVEFSLDSSVGGISLSRTSGFTNSQGLITTQVSAGTVPTVVRVTAKASMEVNGETVTVQTQSNELSVNTGLPEQASMTIAATVLNPEASTIGEESVIRVWLADSFNNPVPDGTTVNFTTEGGNIGSSCYTVSGNCAVTWKATEPYLLDHRSTILATTIGHETFFDSNGDNVFDDSDGNAVTNAFVDSGFGRQTALASGFVDMTEAWRDDDEDNVKDATETKFFDANGDGEFSLADGKFNGPQCIGTKCDSNAKKATLRKALVLIMSNAHNPNYVLTDTSESVIYADNNGANATLPTIPDGLSLRLRFRFADSAMQTMPMGTIVSVTLDGGELQGTTEVEVGNTNIAGFSELNFTINNIAGNDPEQATLTISIDTPNTLPSAYVSKTITLL